MAQRSDVDVYLSALLQSASFKDYGPNGLQIEGRAQVCRLVSGVTASRALIDAAIEAEADAVLVHHGLFWRGHDGCITGWLKQRVQRLLAHDINLLAYHLPLDAHPQFGNNAQLGLRMGVSADARFGEQSLGFIGTPEAPLTTKNLVERLAQMSGRTPSIIEGDARPLRRIAWCTGGAQSYFEAAIAAGADVFVTGEMSEPQVHLARETGVAFIACGHHASERYGVQALGDHLATQFAIEHRYIEIDSPA
ncbi:MAG: Nif3-like dinuclear metal center hexameric protein [Burkholderiales bacterium 28-67-8]|nr:MAG: Nif3-like dinuclear metal center hexameric protein [Burkholderiales bacterium 28-67-8]